MKRQESILITTSETVAGREITQTLGLVRGNTVRARHIGSDIGAALKGLVGGEIRGYVKVMTDARDEAIERMLKEAGEIGADAVVATRFSTSQVMDGSAEILAYGTAVTLR